MEGNILRGVSRGGRDRHRGENAIRKTRRPLQDLHAAHGTAGDTKQHVYAEMINEHGLRMNHVLDRDHRKIEAIGPAGRRIERGGPRGAHAAADDI